MMKEHVPNILPCEMMSIADMHTFHGAQYMNMEDARWYLSNENSTALHHGKLLGAETECTSMIIINDQNCSCTSTQTSRYMLCLVTLK